MKTTPPSSHKHRVYIELNRLSFDFAPQFDLEEEKASVPAGLSSMHFLWLVCVDLGFGHSARPFCWKNTTVDILKTIHLLRLFVFEWRNYWPSEKIQHSSPSSKFFTDHKEERGASAAGGGLLKCTPAKGGDDDDDDYIMMQCLCVCLSRKIITSHFRAERQRRKVSGLLDLAGRRPSDYDDDDIWGDHSCSKIGTFCHQNLHCL